MNKIVIYTALFGKDHMLILRHKKLEGVDYICFTDKDVKSDFWKIVKVDPPFPSDSTRSSKKFKILPHRFLHEYDTSVWVDNNLLIYKDIKPLVNDSLFRSYNHNDDRSIVDRRDCIYSEYEAILKLGNLRGTFKDDPSIMKKQIEFYKEKGYPKNNGLIEGSFLIRKHNNPTSILVMEDWWREIKRFSKRDQLSFNYIAWKHNFKLDYIDGAVRDSGYFYFLDKRKMNKSNPLYG